MINVRKRTAIAQDNLHLRLTLVLHTSGQGSGVVEAGRDEVMIELQASADDGRRWRGDGKRQIRVKRKLRACVSRMVDLYRHIIQHHVRFTTMT